MQYIEKPRLSDEEYLRKFQMISSQHRVPLSGSLDLTHRCNLRCIHCYLAGCSRNKNHKEMDTSQIVSVIDEIAEAGCLFFLITGGEPLVRDDFPEIYSHAKNKGLIVTIFTNGTLITDSILDMFGELPPHTVEISLYGATASTYENVTRVPGSFEKCLKGIRQLMERNVRVRLKTILMTVNSHEFLDIESFARERGVKFRFDAEIFPCFNGDKNPLGLRVSPEEAVAKEFQNRERAESWKKYFMENQGEWQSTTLYQCGAGITSFHIDPYGNLKPCIMINDMNYNLLQGTFSKGWFGSLSRIKDKKTENIYHCNQCEKKQLCDFCPAFFQLENESVDIRSEYLCSIGNQRFQSIQKLIDQGV